MSRLSLAVLLGVLLPAAPAVAAPRFETMPGYSAPGTPAKYDKVGILEVGSTKAKNVLVLNPGTSSGAAYFEPLAESIVARAPQWQVWAVERRENLLEDQSVFDRAKVGQAKAQQVFDYYFGWLDDPSISPHFQLIPDSQVGYAHDWGMNTEIQDLRRVVLRAERRGGKVIVGGHSLGGTITTAYATWNFGGRPGADGLAGLVFIDGASRPTPIGAAAARDALQKLDAGSPWSVIGSIPAPFVGLFNAAGSLSASLWPNLTSLAPGLKVLPADLKPPVPVTNAAEYGHALDTKTSPKSLALAQAHLGHLAASGDPRGWDDAGELTPVSRYARMFSGWMIKGHDGTAWYHPARLSLDGGAVGNGLANPAQKTLDVHATHGRDLPRSLRIYAFAAALGGTRVLDATRALAKQSGIPMSQVELVDRHLTYAHNDPNSASPGRNDFLKRLIPFLGAVARR